MMTNIQTVQKSEIIRAVKSILKEQDSNIRIQDIMCKANQRLSTEAKLDRKLTVRLLVEILDK